MGAPDKTICDTIIRALSCSTGGGGAVGASWSVKSQPPSQLVGGWRLGRQKPLPNTQPSQPPSPLNTDCAFTNKAHHRMGGGFKFDQKEKLKR